MAVLFWTNDDTGDTVTVRFDAVTSEDPTDSVTITDHPVEQGANVVDHARDEPERITIEGYITNTPHHANLGPDDDNVESLLALSAPIRGPAPQINVQLNVPSPPIQISESGLIQAGAQALGNAIFGGPNHTATALSGITPAASLSVTAKALQSPSGKDRAREAYEKLLDALKNRSLVTVQADMREYFDMLIERVGKPRVTGDGTAVKFQVDLRRLRIAESKSVTAPQPTEARGSTSKSLGSQAVKPDPNPVPKESIAHKLLFADS